MNGQTVTIEIPLEILKQAIAKLPPEEKKEVAKVAMGKKPKKKKTLQGILKGMVVHEKDFKEAEKSLFKHAYDFPG